MLKTLNTNNRFACGYPSRSRSCPLPRRFKHQGVWERLWEVSLSVILGGSILGSLMLVLTAL